MSDFYSNTLNAGSSFGMITFPSETRSWATTPGSEMAFQESLNRSFSPLDLSANLTDAGGRFALASIGSALTGILEKLGLGQPGRETATPANAAPPAPPAAIATPGQPYEFTASATAIASPKGEVAKSAYSFIDSIGVVTHLRYSDTGYGYFTDVVAPRLQELGIHHIRDGGHDPAFYQKLTQLAQAGIKATLVMDPRDGITPTEAVNGVQQVLPAIDAVEGPNEWDVAGQTYAGQPFPNGLRQFQTELYQAMKANPATAAIPVLGPSMAIPYFGSQLGDLSGAMDMGNMHSYAGGGLPAQDLDWKWIPLTQQVSGKKPIVATETGWHNAINDPGASQKGVSEAVAAKYVPRLYLEYFNRGVQRTFLYELMDEHLAANQENNFGLLRADGSAKPAFTAEKNLIALLNDSQPIAHLGSLDYTLSGDTQNVNHTLLEKSNGDFYLVLWNNVASTEATASKTVTLNLNTPIQQASTYLPNQSLQVLGQYNAPQQITLTVPDAPLVVKLTPQAIAGL